MTVTIVYETHSITTDNEAGIATGHLPGELSALGREQAAELGARRRGDGLAAVFTSDLRRSVQTAEIAFADCDIPLRQDARLRECDYGDLNGMPVGRLAGQRAAHISTPWPGGQSYHDVVDRTAEFLRELARDWDGARVLLIAHTANRWALDHLLKGVPLEDVVDAPFTWQEGWTYLLPARWCRDAPIVTERLTLAPLTVADADEMAEVLSAPALYTFTGGAPPTPDALRARYAKLAEGWSPDARQEWRNWIIRRRADDRAVGTVQATIVEEDRQAEIAWVIGLPWQRQGYATEAALALTGWLDDRGVPRIQAHIHPAHHASMAVATRIGLTPTHHFEDGERRWERPAS
ncbi:GNAT family N-acetyltransferase [Sphaerisporangium aureirubrum]|uniref:GNAT family N-acetyltransferase n=1 Tax=Sphaerisporangium aureirubrum TaxID=1544736 RepID=UPI0036D417DC